MNSPLSPFHGLAKTFRLRHPTIQRQRPTMDTDSQMVCDAAASPIAS